MTSDEKLEVWFNQNPDFYLRFLRQDEENVSNYEMDLATIRKSFPKVKELHCGTERMWVTGDLFCVRVDYLYFRHNGLKISYDRTKNCLALVNLKKKTKSISSSYVFKVYTDYENELHNHLFFKFTDLKHIPVHMLEKFGYIQKEI
jgi:hypothetical protein